MTFDPLAAAATAILVLLVLAAHAAYRHIRARLSAMRETARREGYDAAHRHGLRPLPIEEVTWRTDN